MFEPNNTFIKCFLLIFFGLFYSYINFMIFKSSIKNFKNSKSYVKVYKIISICYSIFMTFAIGLLIIERFIHFNSWHIGGVN